MILVQIFRFERFSGWLEFVNVLLDYLMLIVLGQVVKQLLLVDDFMSTVSSYFPSLRSDS